MNEKTEKYAGSNQALLGLKKKKAKYVSINHRTWKLMGYGDSFFMMKMDDWRYEHKELHLIQKKVRLKDEAMECEYCMGQLLVKIPD